RSRWSRRPSLHRARAFMKVRGRKAKAKGKQVRRRTAVLKPSILSAPADTPDSLKRALDEALDQQSATFEVLRVISQSRGDLKPVFQSILRNAIRICEAKFGVHFRFDGKLLHAVAWEGVSPRFAKVLRSKPLHKGDGSATGRAAKLRQVVHLVDFQADRGGSNDASVKVPPAPAAVRT